MKKLLLTVLCAALFTSCRTAEKTQKSEDDKSIERLRALRTSSVIPVMGGMENNTENANISDKLYKPLNYETQKGMWLSYIDLAPMLSLDNEADFSAAFDSACKNIADLGCNTVYAHVRPFGDSIYPSVLYPPAQGLGGEFDYLEIMCDIAHENDLSIHAWINPLRLQSESVLANIDTNYQTSQWYAEGSDKLRQVGDNLWLDPAYDDVRSLIAEGAAEIVRNYEIDGIHYDDYFYPTTDASFDAQCYSQNSRSLSLAAWRIDNINVMCQQIYNAVKAENSRVLVGISPQGNVENDYDMLYADVKRWCSQAGYCDYILPQLYYGYDNPVKPFGPTLAQWQGFCSSGDISLVIGLAAYKIGIEDEFTGSVGIIASQLDDCFEAPVCGGAAIYTFGSLFGGEAENSVRINAEIIRIKDALTGIPDVKIQ